MITIDEFKKLEIKIGQILSVEKVPETDKLLKLSVGMGEETPRQIVSGIAGFFPDFRCNPLVPLQHVLGAFPEPQSLCERQFPVPCFDSNLLIFKFIVTQILGLWFFRN